MFLSAKAQSRMENIVTLDVIIPSVRSDSVALNKILQLPHSDALRVTFCIVQDNPSDIALPKAKIANAQVLVVRNPTNLGAPMSRNVGIAATCSEWILFLDDDVEPQTDLLFHYEEFICKHGSVYMGAIGMTQFPPPVNSFTRGIRASDILTFFEIAGWYSSLKWGITANVLINRGAIVRQRFSSDYPKNGGGEDIDFFLRCGVNGERNFLCLPHARVQHGWWFAGKRTYRRFFRWAYGDSLLPKRFPRFKFWNFPNIAELMLLWLVALPLCVYVDSALAVLIPLGILLGDAGVEYLKQIIEKHTWNPLVALEAAAIRCANDFGRCCGNLSRRRIWFIGERFDYFCDGKHIKHERLWALLKTAGYAVGFWLLLRMLHL